MRTSDFSCSEYLIPALVIKAFNFPVRCKTISSEVTRIVMVRLCARRCLNCSLSGEEVLSKRKVNTGRLKNGSYS